MTVDEVLKAEIPEGEPILSYIKNELQANIKDAVEGRDVYSELYVKKACAAFSVLHDLATGKKVLVDKRMESCEGCPWWQETVASNFPGQMFCTNPECPLYLQALGRKNDVRAAAFSEVRRIVGEVEARYPISVFGEPTGQVVGNTARYAAAGARVACQGIKALLDEIEGGRR